MFVYTVCVISDCIVFFRVLILYFVYFSTLLVICSAVRSCREVMVTRYVYQEANCLLIVDCNLIGSRLFLLCHF